jgi:catechol 2,3-dioxygenase-like lactoylglutathione lyase family enzyme
MPRLNSAVPTFLVTDVGKTTRWYAQHLGFTVSTFPKNEPYVYGSMQRDDAEIMLLRQENFVKPEIARPAGVWDAYIRMNGVHEFYESVRTNVRVQRALAMQPYGSWEFEVRDPNDYVLVFGEFGDDVDQKLQAETAKATESR